MGLGVCIYRICWINCIQHRLKSVPCTMTLIVLCESLRFAILDDYLLIRWQWPLVIALYSVMECRVVKVFAKIEYPFLEKIIWRILGRPFWAQFSLLRNGKRDNLSIPLISLIIQFIKIVTKTI